MKNSSPYNKLFQGFYIQANSVMNSDTICHLKVKARYSEDYMHKMNSIITFSLELLIIKLLRQDRMVQ